MQQHAVEFTLDGETYEIGAMNLLDQTDVVAMVSPLLMPLAKAAMADGSLAKLRDAPDDERKKEAMNAFFGNFEMMAKLLAEMKSEQRHELMTKCLKVVKRRTGQTAMPIWNEHAGEMQFSELNSIWKAGRILWEVINARLRPF